MQRNLFVVMRVCSPGVLSYLDAGFEPQCGRKDLLLACCCCCCLLLAVAAKTCCSSLDPIKTRTRTELGPSLAQHIRSACTPWSMGVVVSPELKIIKKDW